MAKRIPSILMLLLTGCASQHPIAVPVDVDMPVAAACNAHPPSRPHWNLPDAPADEAGKLRAALADLELSKAYIVELEAALAACG